MDVRAKGSALCSAWKNGVGANPVCTQLVINSIISNSVV